MSVLSVLCYSEKMFQAAADSRCHGEISYAKKHTGHVDYDGSADQGASKKQIAAPPLKVASPVAHVSITPGL